MSLDQMGNSPRSDKLGNKLDGPQNSEEQQSSVNVSETNRSDTRRVRASNAPKKRKKFQNNFRNNNHNSVGTFSAIDLGTNNCRLLIAKPTKNGFRVVDAFSRIVRLGEGVAKTGDMSQEAMDRTIEALKVCAEKIQRKNVVGMRHVATEACRVAGNSDEFITRVKNETGITLDVISSAEEAELAVMGCQSLIAYHNKHALIFDIGGGSTELIWVKSLRRGRTEILGWTSIPWGVVNLAETFSYPGDSVSAETYEKMLSSVQEHLHEFDKKYDIGDTCKHRKTQFLGTSGTVTTLAGLHLNLKVYDRSKVDGLWMKTADAIKLSKDVAEMSYGERCAISTIGEERADLVVAGCAILDALLGMWKVKSLRVADRGIREGILRSLMNKDKPPRSAKNVNLDKILDK